MMGLWPALLLPMILHYCYTTPKLSCDMPGLSGINLRLLIPINESIQRKFAAPDFSHSLPHVPDNYGYSLELLKLYASIVSRHYLGAVFLYKLP